MTSLGELIFGRWLRAWAALAAICLVGVAGSAWAKTPDGMPPSVETVCSGLKGAAFGLCNAYCEAQDCDVHPRPSCAVLQRNFEKLTGSAIFPCDRRCGNGTIDRGEECDPPGSECANGELCTNDCTCPAPICGNGAIDPGEDCDPPGSPCADGSLCTTDCTCPAPVCGNGTIDPGEDCDPPGSPCNDGTAVCANDCTCPTPKCGDGTVDPGEQCDPPGSPCADGVTCTPDCTCPAPLCGNGVLDPGEQCDPPGSPCPDGSPCSTTCSCGTEPTGCCECPAGTTAPMCQDGVTQSTCLAHNCLFGLPGTACDPALGRCVPTRNCCQCPGNVCTTVSSPDQCPTGCTAVPAPSMCDAAGTCQQSPIP